MSASLPSKVNGHDGSIIRSVDAEAAQRTILAYIGEDVGRDGLLETPRRVIKAMRELTSGYTANIPEIFKTFDNDADYGGMVLVKDINFYSLCEHHMLPFAGKVHVAYVPDGRIVGLSKLARLVDAFARRLQVQEKLTQQVHDTLCEHLAPRGAFVMVEAEHFCMAMRGVQKQGSSTVTTALSGVFEKPETRDEVLRSVARN